MTGPEKSRQLARLGTLTDLMLDARLADLRGAAAARDASLARLADLARPAAATDLPDMAAAEVEMRYQRWADQRRAEINLTLARQTAAWLDARQAATLAFGKSQVLDGLARVLRKKAGR